MRTFFTVASAAAVIALSVFPSDPKPYPPVSLGSNAPKNCASVWRVAMKHVGSATAFPVGRKDNLLVFVTAGHVLDTMKTATTIVESLDKVRKLLVVDKLRHKKLDVGLLYVKDDGKAVEMFCLEPNVLRTPGLSVFTSGFCVPASMWFVHRGYLAGDTTMSAIVRPGMSGGPVLLNNGNVLGIVSGGMVERGTEYVYSPLDVPIGRFFYVDAYPEQSLYVPVQFVMEWLGEHVGL